MMMRFGGGCDYTSKRLERSHRRIDGQATTEPTHKPANERAGCHHDFGCKVFAPGCTAQ
jgi:hypothetical protein